MVAGALTVTSNDQNACTAAAAPKSVSATQASIQFKVTYGLTEVGTTQDLWEFRLEKVVWIQWPTDILGNGASPGDDTTGATTTIPDTYNQNDTRTGELLSKTWSPADFEVDGEYKAEVYMDVKYSNAASWGGAIQQKCHPSAISEITIAYAHGGTESIIVITVPGGGQN